MSRAAARAVSNEVLVANPGRLRILMTLAAAGRQEFVRLRDQTRLTDGNLAAHARRLSSAGLVRMEKFFRAGKPVTSFDLTASGRQALESHARELLAAIGGPPAGVVPAPVVPPPSPAEVDEGADDDDWVD